MATKKKLVAFVATQEEKRLISVQVDLSELLKKVTPFGNKLFRKGEEIGIAVKQTASGDILILIGPPETIEPR
jgi:hypothetical protein